MVIVRDFGPNEVLAAGLGASAVDSAVFAPDGLLRAAGHCFMDAAPFTSKSLIRFDVLRVTDFHSREYLISMTRNCTAESDDACDTFGMT